jgi:tetratricopeptide (TPR) repeat protein
VTIFYTYPEPTPASLAIGERLAKADPGNAGWQRDLSVSHDNIGDVQQAQGNLAAALTSYQASLAIRYRLAKADPGNAGWQRDLALSYSRVALIEKRQGGRDDALKAFRQGRDIIAQLMRRSPDNVTFPKAVERLELSWLYRVDGDERPRISARGAIAETG